MGRPVNSVERMLVVDVDTGGDCWIWKGSVTANGYGKTAVLKKSKLPHRLFYEHFKGKIPFGFQVDHLCRNRLCVNPAHLEAVTPRENVLRSTSVAARNSEKTQCIRGHALTDGNLYVTPDGRRQCKACRNRASKQYADRTSV